MDSTDADEQRTNLMEFNKYSKAAQGGRARYFALFVFVNLYGFKDRRGPFSSQGNASGVKFIFLFL